MIQSSATPEQCLPDTRNTLLTGPREIHHAAPAEYVSLPLTTEFAMIDSGVGDSAVTAMTVEEENMLFYGEDEQGQVCNNMRNITICIQDEASKGSDTGSHHESTHEAINSMRSINVDWRPIELSGSNGTSLKAGHKIISIVLMC
ncbi:hypothetical protein VTL71DRAFT_12550 [Oculimacula yallundae]|uniref:Uncharacterized protein n=1 Tax=Oculimacula yallundae TaxID=86028 RepID=A0ABR4CMW0_9HELO